MPRPSLGHHLTGKAVFKQINGRLVCIDGQQRTTTTSLFLAALRDAALEQVRAGDPTPSALVEEVDLLLFRDPPRVYAWADEHAQARGEQIHDGSDQPFGVPLLLPSFEDRVPFFEAITKGILEEAYLKAGKAQQAAGTEEAASKSSLQSRAKGFFDKQLRRSLRRHRTHKAQRELLAALARTALDIMAITFCEILNEIDLPQVFLWFQEKSLFSMGALLHNPAPGLPFRAADLLRNLVLAPSMRLPMEEQERLYREAWLQPFERANGGSSKLDPILEAFLVEKMDRRTHRHVCSLEQFAVAFLSSPAGTMVSQKTDLAGVLRYARLMSFAESCELRREGQQLSMKETPIALSQETCDQVISMLISFANKQRRGVPPVPEFCAADLDKSGG